MTKSVGRNYDFSHKVDHGDAVEVYHHLEENQDFMAYFDLSWKTLLCSIRKII